MRLTLAWLCVCLAIYCGGGFANNGHGNVVLSLPPSLIAATEAVALRQLQQQQQQQQQQQRHEQTRWKKDARVLFDSVGGSGDALRDMLHSKESTTSSNNNLPYNDNNGMEVEQQQSQQQQQQQQPQQTDFNRKALSEAYDLEARQQSAPQEIAARRGHGHGRAAAAAAAVGVQYATPTPTSNSNSNSRSAIHKYWSRLCQAANGNCPREYNRAMLAVRNREAVARLQRELHEMQDQLDSDYEDGNDDYADMDDSSEEHHLKNSNNEVFLLLTGEQDLVKFLHWAMQLLYPHQHGANGGKLDANSADFYHPGMFIWKKLNFSGHLEPPLIVDEPRYVLVRREKQNPKEGYQLGDELKALDDPFIPPRGRKQHNAPDLDALLNRYETFVPNRGKRDKVKDLFKYDDLFFPNRGKKHRDIFKLDDPFFPHRGKKLQLRDLYNVDDPFFPNRGKRHLPSGNNKVDDIDSNNERNNDKGDNWPQRMSTHEINSNDQSVKSSMSAEDAGAAAAAAGLPMQWQLSMPMSLPANRLHSTRSMSASTLATSHPLQRLRFIVNPSMRQQQQQQQVKTSWPAGIQLTRLQSALHDARETQLTRGPNTDGDSNGDSDSDIDIDYGQLDM
ncbi:uncharacterized protein LOC132786898 [Drosophila nasuta]|uniref:uncharacterized protein LOC132786898 n=1 Tax=Drosophila nasuta TaxID=42062 RepID=UPI00295F48AB|nr:uncharacterized protein LOC132786898 [Drosophila nasuta]